MRFSSCLVLLLLISCGSGEVKKNMEEVTYQTSGVEQFFLPELPGWANYSSSGQCYKSSSFTYLDFNKVALSYELTYPQLLELQAQFNDRLETYFRSTTARFLKPVEQASFFSNTLEQVRGGVKQLKFPVVPELDVIWLDAFVAANKIEDLKRMAAAGKFEERLPILFSGCLSRQDLSKWISEHNLDQIGFYLLSAEWLSPYTRELKTTPGLKVNLKALVDPKTKINVITPNIKFRPTELIIN